MARTNPTSEIGNAGNGIAAWSSFSDDAEEVPELAFPNSIKTYDRMRNDEQIAHLFLSFVLPIFGYAWSIDPNGARDEVVEHVATDFNLPILGAAKRVQGRQRDRFSFGEYLEHSLLKLHYGFQFFEQVYRYGDDGKLHIRKLAPRMAKSIIEIGSASDGGLTYIRQSPIAASSSDPITAQGYNGFFGADLKGPRIPVDRLVAHINEKEGGNWYGRSWNRALHRVWMLKDQALRVEAMTNQRNGMGVPTITGPIDASKKLMLKLAALAMSYKSGDASGGALPHGSELKINGVSGTLPNVRESIKGYDEAMSRRFLNMFSMLGTTQSGSRAVGETFVDYYALAQESVATSFQRVTNAHVIEDLVDVNYSIDESAPLLVFDADPDLAIGVLVDLVKAGLITTDTETENFVRAATNLPKLSSIRPQVSARQRERILALGPRAEQRDPSPVEEQSKADFEAIKQAFDDALHAVVNTWSTDIKPRQIAELVAAIEAIAADDLQTLAAIQATPIGSDLIAESMHSLAATAVGHALDELKAQGVELEVPDTTDLEARLTERAGVIDQLMANAISQAAREVAVREGGGALSSQDIAADVSEHLTGLSNAYLNDELGGALMQAQNSARTTVFDLVEHKTIYASEILDLHTCENCDGVDGNPYDTMDAAKEDYPSGGYRDCLGGLRCRGTLVIVAGTESNPSIA